MAGTGFVCVAEPGGDMFVSFVTGTPAEPFDNRALGRLLRPGMRVNLVDPQPAGTDGMVHARFIVAQPDYLVNATAVAGCMADYGDGPLVWLMRRLAPAPNSQALQLGNFAGQLLDESLHAGLHRRAYSDSVRDFFRTAAMSIMSLGSGFDGRKFHEESLRQQTNIRHAVEDILPALAPGFSPRDAVVEPSFFCEALGLQGRMDCLAIDGSLVVEQKSGKAAFGCRLTERPEWRREHNLQLTLYRLALRYGWPGTDASACLLYSKYDEPVVECGGSENMAQYAMALRNRLALAELGYADDGFAVLASLTPEALNTRGADGRLWRDYQRPQLERVLRPVREADPVARAYFMRMMRFVALEHRLAKLGSDPADGTSFASAWHCPPAMKREAGTMLDGLRLLEPAAGHEGVVVEITLEITADDANDSSNFRSNDIVLLYSYDPASEPDLRRALPLRCILLSVAAGLVRLELRTPQSDARVLLRDVSRLWAIEHDFMESASDRLLRGLHSLLRAPAARRGLFLGLRRPEVDRAVRLTGDYGAFNPVVLAARQARELFLIVGPPGTGKTSHALMGILREELTDPEAAVILTAYTNRAVDEICRNLEDAGMDYLRLGPRSACPGFCRGRTVSAAVESCSGLADLRRRFEEVRIIAGTSAAVNSRPELLRLRRFSLAIVDEASQILEPQIASLFSAADGDVPSVGRFVLIGDHRQLPAVVRQSPAESRIDEPELRAIGFDNCRVSLFERLYRRYAGMEEHSCMLAVQGRMHPAIAAFPSEAFYCGLLRPVPLPHQQRELPRERVRFVAVRPAPGEARGKINHAEARVIAGIVADVRRAAGSAFDASSDIGVIVPYRNQIAAVRAAIAACGVDEAADITIDTVERYQGSQRGHIVYGTVVSRTSQLDFLCDSTVRDVDGSLVDRRLNVALTRAREYLTVVGNPDILCGSAVYASLLRHLGVRP